MRTRGLTAAVVCLLATSLAATVDAGVVKQRQDGDMRPTGKGWGESSTAQPQAVAGQARAARPVRGSGINYHNGPVLLGTTNVYYIWYGNWSTSAQSILTSLASSIGGSPYFNINTTYYSTNTGSKKFVTNAVHYAGATGDNYSHGTALSDSGVKAVVSSAIANGQLPKDTNAVYFVLTSADVNETSGFCTQYCGWHTHGTISGSDIKYSFVGNPARCPSACTNGTTPPNGDVGADGAASIIAHELEETVTDPDLNAWYDSRGAENADKCAWTFGTIYTTSNGGRANINLGGDDYLIQRNWVNAGKGSCATQYP
jgi:Phosphate-induced protein 1 conserved region